MKYPEHAGELDDQGHYYCVICATKDPDVHDEQVHKDFEEWKKECQKRAALTVRE